MSEFLVHKAEVLNPSSNSNNKNKKKCMLAQLKALSNKDITIIKVVSHMKYTDVKLICSITFGKSKTNVV